MTIRMTPEERETTIVWSDADQYIRVTTFQRALVRRLIRDARFTQVKGGEWGGNPWGEFTIAADQWSPVSGVRRLGRPLSDEARAALAEGRAKSAARVADSASSAAQEEVGPVRG